MGARGRARLPVPVQKDSELDEDEDLTDSLARQESANSANKVLEKFITLVIKAATDAATGLTMAASGMANLEQETRDLKGEIISLKTEVASLKNELKLVEKAKGTTLKAWVGFFKSSFTAPVILQLLVLIGIALGLYSQRPAPSAAIRDTVVEDHHAEPMKASDSDRFEP